MTLKERIGSLPVFGSHEASPRWSAAGAALDYERALPAANRLPSGVSVTAVLRYAF
jgi:hypothetical protein